MKKLFLSIFNFCKDGLDRSVVLLIPLAALILTFYLLYTNFQKTFWYLVLYSILSVLCAFIVFFAQHFLIIYVVRTINKFKE
jgi:hypothetical protein